MEVQKRSSGYISAKWVFGLFFALIIGLLSASLARADLVNLGGAEVAPNIAEIHVQDDGVLVKLEIFVGDLHRFTELVPSEWMGKADVTPSRDEDRLRAFSETGLSIRADRGPPLPIERLTAERRLRVDRASPLAGQVDPYSGRRLPAPPDDPRVLYTELFYSFEGERPNSLVISPPQDSDGAPLTIGMVVFHHAVPVIDFRFLSAPATLELDWDDPWYSSFDNPNLRRHHSYPRMTYLYADPFEIRHEALVRVRDALALVGMTPAAGELTDKEAFALAEATAQKIGASTPLAIEGALVNADFDRSAYMRIGLRGLEFLQPGEAVNVDADILGLIWSTPTEGLPQNAELEWNWFDEEVSDVAGYAVDAAGPFLYPLTAEDRRVVWTNHFKVDPYPEITAIAVELPEGPAPMTAILGGLVVVGLGGLGIGLLRRRSGGRAIMLVGGAVAVLALAAIPLSQSRKANRIPPMKTDKLSALTSDLLNNVYRAFDFRTEDEVYDRLALTLDGSILEQVYLDQREAMRIERAGGADAKLEELETVAVEQLEGGIAGELRLKVDWIVRGSVGHWGHVHRRTNGYEAEISIAPIEGRWKIRDFDVLSQERL